MKKVSKTYLVAAAVFCSMAGAVHAQSLSNITVPPELAKGKSTKVSAELSQLEGRFRRGAVQSDSVTIEAIASTSGSALLRELQSIGLTGGAVFGNLVSGQLPLSSVSSAANLPALNFISVPRAIRRAGSVDNQADIAMDSISARATFGVDGDGVVIGILSDSYNQLSGEAADIASGDLPSGGVTVLDDSATGSNIDEGRAMAQLIHDIAPGAKLLFHTAFNGRPDFAQGIIDLANAGATVIVDDIGYLDAPMYQDGVVAQAVDQVVADGVTYFSAAGNSADSSYEAKYDDTGTSGAGGLPLKNIHGFDDGGAILQEIRLPAGASTLLSIQWDQPFASSGGIGAATDVDAYLINEAMDTIVASGVDANIGNDAVEIMFYQNNTGADTSVFLIIGLFDDPGNGPVPNFIKWIDFNGPHAHNFATDSSTIFAHPNASGAIAVGAAAYFDTPAFGTSPPEIESFSSHGGLEVLFAPSGNPISPDDRNKPEVVAPDGVDNTFFGFDFEPNGFPNFFGTSAAAPHAAAIAALQLQCDVSLSPAEIESQQAGTAIDMESSGFDNISGTGLIDAPAVLAKACPPVVVLTCNGLPVTVDLNLGESPTAGDDVIYGTPGNDIINGLGGNDTICGGLGRDTIFGSAGDDWITGGDSDGTENLFDFNDIFGGNGNDTLIGSEADDFFFGQSGVDTIKGNNSRAFRDEIFGGSGNDIMTSNATGGVGSLMRGQGNNDEIFGSQYSDEITGDPGLDEIFGGNGDDVINGGRGADIVHGDEGNDTLIGAANRDELFGGVGDDELFGGLGNDLLDGGANTAVGDTCNGQGGLDTLVDCETAPTGNGATTNSETIVITRTIDVGTARPGRIQLTEDELRRIDRCDATLSECLGGTPSLSLPTNILVPNILAPTKGG